MIKFTRYRHNDSDILGKRVFLKGDPYKIVKIYGPLVVYQIVGTDRIILVKQNDTIPGPRATIRGALSEYAASESQRYSRRVYFSSEERFKEVLKQAINIEDIIFGAFRSVTELRSEYEFELYD